MRPRCLAQQSRRGIPTSPRSTGNGLCYADTCSPRPCGRHVCRLPSTQFIAEAPPSSRLRVWGFLIPYQDSKPAKSTVKNTITIGDVETAPKLQSKAVERSLCETRPPVLNSGHEPARLTLRSRWSRVADDPNYALRRPAAVLPARATLHSSRTRTLISGRHERD